MKGKTALGGIKKETDPQRIGGSLPQDITTKLQSVLAKVWGFDSFRPLQLDAMQSVMGNQDSLIVFPTGGGKSLCFQAPAVCRNELGIVVSPLDLIDEGSSRRLAGLRRPGRVFEQLFVAAAESQVIRQIQNGELQLLYLAPERLLTEKTQQLLGRQLGGVLCDR